MKSILATVILPVYNTSPSMLLSSINSILNQSYSNLELIIIDDCSDNQGTIDILSRLHDKRIQLIKNETNYGISKSLNIGLNKSHGKYIFRMDSDDIALRNRIRDCIIYLEKNVQLDIIGTNAIYFGNWVIPTYYSSKKSSFLLRMLYTSPLIHPTVVFRKSFVEKVGLEYLSIPAEDYDLWTRCLLDYKANIGIYKKITLLYRTHNNQLSKVKSENIALSFNMSRNKFLDSFGFDDDTREIITKYFNPHYKLVNNLDENYKYVISLILSNFSLNSKENIELRIKLLLLNFKWGLLYVNFTRFKSIKHIF